VCTKLSKMTQK